jgi:DNA-binding CsgD family transcriptional regulator
MSLRALQSVLPQLARCRKPSDVGGVSADAARRAFGTHVCGVIFLDESSHVSERALCGMRDADFDEWDQRWRPLERVFPAMLERAVPMHNWQLYRQQEWESDRPYLEFGKRLQIYHYMSAPIFGSRGTLVGAINFCRRPQDQSFDHQGLAIASALSGFVSATLARVTEAPTAEAGPGAILSYRELQVARIAAGGRNNLEIALQLGIARETVKQTLRRVYCKLEVNGRAAMAAKLVLHGLWR